MFVFSVARPFVCGCHIISTLPSARTIPGLPGSLASLLHRVARTHLGAMGWNQCAFAPIVRARPFPIFGRPVHPRDGSRRLRPGGSPHALQTPPRGGRPALQSFRSWLQLCLGRIRLSPSCPFRHLHYLSTLRPVRHYPHLLDIDPWPRAERDFNPPETRAARHALRTSPPPCRPNLTLAGCRLAHATPPAGLPVLRPSPPSTRAAATTPAEPVGARVARFPTAGSLPRIPGGSASASLRYEACAAFTSLRPAWSLNRPGRPFVIGVLQPMSLPPSSAPTATGWSDSCRAGFAPAGEWRLSRRTKIQR